MKSGKRIKKRWKRRKRGDRRVDNLEMKPGGNGGRREGGGELMGEERVCDMLTEREGRRAGYLRPSG